MLQTNNPKLILLTTGIVSPSFSEVHKEISFKEQGGKLSFVPNLDGSVHDILYADHDYNKPIPDWIKNIPYWCWGGWWGLHAVV